MARRAAALSSRDRGVLRQLADHRFLESQQVADLEFVGHATAATAQRICRRTLSRLERDGLIRPLGRQVGGQLGGSTAMIWQLTAAGGRLAFETAGTRYRPLEPSPRTLQHCLAVADAHIALRGLTDEPGVGDVSVQLEPACWRSYSGMGGERRSLQPDLAAVIRGTDAAGDFEDRWFIEVDLATESVATLVRKCQQYQDYRDSGVEQAIHQGVFPLVLWIMHGPRGMERARQVGAKIQRAQSLEQALYRFAEPATARAALLGGTA